MEPEVLLRLTLLRFHKRNLGTQVAGSLESSHSLMRSAHLAINALCESFAEFWADEVAHRITVNASLMNVLLFLMPSQWGGEPCENYYLKDDTDEKTDSQYLKDHCLTHQVFERKAPPDASFFPTFQQLIDLLQPKLHQFCSSLKEWMTSLDSILLSLRTFFVSLHSAFLISFCEVDRQLVVSHRSAAWAEERQIYCIAVCDLCRLLDSQLVAVVTRTISTQVDSAYGCVRTFLFKHSASLSAEAASNVIADLISKRLDSIAAYVAATTPFDCTYPNETQRIRFSGTFLASHVDAARRAFCTYVEKLSTTAAGENAPCGNAIPSETAPQLKRNSTKSIQTLDDGDTGATCVSLEQAFSLIAPPEAENLSSRVAAIAPTDDSTLKMVQQLLAVQHFRVSGGQLDEASKLPQPKQSSEPRLSITSLGQLSPTRNASNPRSAEERRTSAPKRSLSPLKQKSNHKETWKFWTRLQQRLSLETVVVQRVSELCKFDNDSPFPGVFLVDLDARNSDRATVAFVEKLQKLIPSELSVGMKAESVRLFKETCTAYASELVDKSKELQSTFPFLSLRANGVLLGSLCAVLRADKQFQLLKQVYLQTSQLKNSSQQSGTDHTLLANVETLIMKRVQFFSRTASDDEAHNHTSDVIAGLTTDPAHRQSYDSGSKEAAHHSVTTTENEGNATPTVPVQCARGHSNASISNARTQGFVERARRRSSVMEAFSEAQKNVSRTEMPTPPPSTRIEEVYQLACRFYGVAANPALMRQLKQAKENYITTLDLSSNYVGVKGLKPVLALLAFNGSYLISLTLCNNNIENEEVEELCRTLEGQAGENLVHLDLSFNPISSSASSNLQRLCVGLPNLESVQLKATLLPPDVVQEIQQLVTAKATQRHF
jgi:hypothetical protein